MAVRPFAVMRQTHEAIRAGLNAIRTSVAANDVDKLHSTVENLHRLINLHREHEDRVFFPLLDKLFDNTCTKAGFTKQHDEDEEFLTSISKAVSENRFGKTNMDQIKQLTERFLDHHEQHLKEEEDIMMPLTQKIGNGPEDTAREVAKIIDYDVSEYENFMLGHVVEALENTKPYPALAVYVAAVRASSDTPSYARRVEIMRKNLSKETQDKLEADGHFGPGTLVRITTI